MFRRQENKKWILRFHGKTRQMDDSIGLRYIAYLLENPNMSFDATDLYFHVNGDGPIMTSLSVAAELSISGVGRGEDMMSKRAINKMNKKRAELQDALEMAQDTQDDARKAQILEELEAR